MRAAVVVKAIPFNNLRHFKERSKRICLFQSGYPDADAGSFQAKVA
jgi:hypothetical protein